MPWIVLVPLFPRSCDVSAGATVHIDPNGAPLATTQHTAEGNGLDPHGGPCTQTRSADSPADTLATTVH